MIYLTRSPRILFPALGLATLLGCHDGGSSPLVSQTPPVAQPQSPTPQITQTHGYFVGGISNTYAEALLTADGLVRVYSDGVPGTYIAGSRQFVGRVDFTDAGGTGTGLVFSIGCDSDVPTSCGGAVPATIGVTTATRHSLLGAITLADGTEWSFDMGWPTTTYLEPATLDSASGQFAETLGQYRETRAEFARDVVINVTSDGSFFFQSPESGCVGNGNLLPHADGAFNVYDITLVIESCGSGFEATNGQFEGLATRTIGDEWGNWLVFWVSTVAAEATPQAFVMWSYRI